MIGAVFHKDEVERHQKRKSGGNPNKIFIPLAMAIRPELSKQLERMFAANQNPYYDEDSGVDYTPDGNTEVVDLNESVSKEEFMKFAAGLRPTGNRIQEQVQAAAAATEAARNALPPKR